MVPAVLCLILQMCCYLTYKLSTKVFISLTLTEIKMNMVERDSNPWPDALYHRATVPCRLGCVDL